MFKAPTLIAMLRDVSLLLMLRYCFDMVCRRAMALFRCCFIVAMRV